MPQKPLIERWLYRFSAKLRCRIINGNQGEPYLERYHLFRLPGGGGVYLHRFVDSDPDRGLHDHPWKAAVSLVLSGGYRELRLQQEKHVNRIVDRQVKSWHLNIIRGDDFHRIVLDQQTSAWTLFAHTGKVKDWGFIKLEQTGDVRYQPQQQVTSEPGHENWWLTAPRGSQIQRTPM